MMLAVYLLAAITAITLALLLGVMFGLPWCRSVFRAWDYLGAALLGGDGRHSISAYCGAMDTPVHKVGRAVIDSIFGALHCWNAAKTEGLR